MGAKASFGTFLKIGDGGGPESFTTILDVADISGPSLALDTEDATTHSSPNAWREFIATLLNGGEVTFTINYDPNAATHNATTGLIRDQKNRTLRNFQLVFPVSGNPTWAFAAFVTGFEPKAPVDSKLTAACKLKISGQPTLV